MKWHRAALNGRGMRSNLAWMVTGTLWSGFCQWSLVVALAKIGTIDMVGAFTLGLAFTFPVMMFSCLNLRALYITDCRCTYRFLEYLALRLMMAAASVVFIAALAVATHCPVALTVSIALIGAAKALEYTSDMLYGLLQRQERMAGISISMMLRGTLSVCALSIGAYWTGSLVWGSAGLVLSSAFVLLAFDIPRSLALLNVKLPDALRECAVYARTVLAGGASGRKRLAALAFSGAPLGVVLMLVSLNVNIPRFFIERSLGMRDLGVFASIANLTAAGTVAIGALGQCVVPRLAKHFAAGEMRAFRALLWPLVCASLGLGAAGLAGALLCGRQALAIIYRPEYSTRQDILVWLMAASAVLYLGVTLGYAMTAARCLTPQLPLFAISAAGTVLACMVLVPTLGLRGAALAILVSALIQCAGGGRLLQQACKRAGTTPIAA